MNTPCEVVVQKILPVIRANLAKELVNRHSMKQELVARHLGLTQPAVSHYLKDFRGKSAFEIRDPKFHRKILEFAEQISSGAADETSKQNFVCTVCRHCRSTALICKFHPPKQKGGCTLCLQPLRCD